MNRIKPIVAGGLAMIAVAAAYASQNPAAHQSINPETPPPPAGAARTLLQAGPWVPAPWNFEEPYIDIIHASDARWSCGDLKTEALYDGGFLDARSGLPAAAPAGCTLTSNVYFTVGRNTGPLETHWDGDWVLDATTAGGGCKAELALLYFPDSHITRRKPCRIEFTRDKASGATPWHMAVQIKRLDAPLETLRMYRAENEAALEAGKIYNPRFIAALAGYDIVRTMDLQQANRGNVRGPDQLAAPDAAHWANVAWKSPENIRHEYYGMPLEAVFAFGVEADAMVWAHAPLTLGSPVDILDPAVFDEDPGKQLGNVNAAVSAAAQEILASDQWDAYADRFVAALEASGYRADRPLYVTLGNEVWNFSGQYLFTTNYAKALGNGLYGTEWGYREGYGAASARFKLALDAALARAGRAQPVIYVIEGQAANIATTRAALQAARDYLEAAGEDWAVHAPGFGVSVASYWGGYGPHLARDGVDPNDLAALEDWFVNGPANSVSTLQWNLAKWRGHAGEAAKYGVALIGAYEGGSHFERPEAMSRENFDAFVWGEAGARVNTAVNQALAEAFPGAILSNYVLCGPTGGQPWFEGPCGADTPMNESWAEWVKK